MVRKAHPIVLAGSANPHKLTEIREILSDQGARVVGTEILRGPVEVVEDGVTFEENAALKAVAFARAAAALPADGRPQWVVSDDSGLCVDALGGAPGIRSARFAGPAASTPENNRLLLEKLRGVKAEDRGAVFVCTVACAGVPSGAEEPRVLFVARGECRGRILEAYRGEGGFGYDPLFFLPGLGKTYAELEAAEKNRISHRALALARFSELFRSVLGAFPPQPPRGGAGTAFPPQPPRGGAGTAFPPQPPRGGAGTAFPPPSPGAGVGTRS